MLRYVYIALLALVLAGSAVSGNPLRGGVVLPIDNGVTLKVYPNPSPRYINIDLTFPNAVESGSVEIRVKNMIGKEMIDHVRQELDGSFKTIEIDLEDLPAGIYLVDVVVEQNGTLSKTTRRITKL